MGLLPRAMLASKPMADCFTAEERSQVMAAVRSRQNKSTELAFVALLRSARIRGWRRHVKMLGSPDFVFRRERLAVFIDGCFWHGCRAHCRMPASNREYWFRKIERNQARDRRTQKELRNRGWRVLRVWEHELREPLRLTRRLKRLFAVNAKRDSRPGT